MKNLMYEFIAWLLRNHDFFLVFRQGGEGGGCIDKEDSVELNKVTLTMMEHDGKICDFILNTAEMYLKNHHPQRTIFAKRVYNEDII